MVEDCKPYTAFTCGPLGFYECETMPFDTTNAPATFQRFMNNCLGELNMYWCIVYLDDIIIYSTDAASHIERLEAVFQKLVKAGLKLKPPSVNFSRRELSILVTLSLKKVFQQILKKWRQSFIGLYQGQFMMSRPF